jgi:hypothetical protein
MHALAKTCEESIHEIEKTLTAGCRLAGAAPPLQYTVKMRHGKGSTRPLSPAIPLPIALSRERGVRPPPQELEEHASRLRRELPLGVERPPRGLFSEAKDAFKVVDIADERTVQVPIVNCFEDELPLPLGQFSKGATEKAGTGGTAVEGETAPVHAFIAGTQGAQEAADSGLLSVQEADELATVEGRIEELEPLLPLRLLRIPQDPVNGPRGEGKTLGASPQPWDQGISPRLPDVVEAAAPGAPLAVVRLTKEGHAGTALDPLFHAPLHRMPYRQRTLVAGIAARPEALPNLYGPLASSVAFWKAVSMSGRWVSSGTTWM